MLQRMQVLLNSWKLFWHWVQVLLTLQVVQLLTEQVMHVPFKREYPGVHWVQMLLLGQVLQPVKLQGIMHCPVAVLSVPLAQLEQKLI
jgi:hypothetical protein